MNQNKQEAGKIPFEIIKMQKNLEAYKALGTIEHLRHLVEAEKQGLLKPKKKETYWELYTIESTGNGFYSYFTGEEVQRKNILQMIEKYKTGDYFVEVGHWKQISEKEYLLKNV